MYSYKLSTKYSIIIAAIEIDSKKFCVLFLTLLFSNSKALVFYMSSALDLSYIK